MNKNMQDDFLNVNTSVRKKKDFEKFFGIDYLIFVLLTYIYIDQNIIEQIVI